jgi:hypothetical protein
MRLMRVALTLGVIAAIVPALFLVAPTAEAQAVTPQLLAQYLGRMSVTWKLDDKDPDVFRITKTTGLKKAEYIEIVITNIPDKDLVTLRAFPKTGGKFLSLAAVRDQTGLMRAMLKNNSTAFGAYILDASGDIGFRYVFTTESGLGYEAFKVAVTELLRIADEVMVPLYTTYR